jgi:hypothetical protein
MTEQQPGPNVFSLTRGELEQLIREHARNARDNAAKVLAETTDETSAGNQWGTKITQVRDILQSAHVALVKRAEEAEYLAEHLAPDDAYRMSAAELLAFRAQFRPVEINVARLVLSAMEAPRPDAQAERALGATLIKVPRLSVPGMTE